MKRKPHDMVSERAFPTFFPDAEWSWDRRTQTRAYIRCQSTDPIGWVWFIRSGGVDHAHGIASTRTRARRKCREAALKLPDAK